MKTSMIKVILSTLLLLSALDASAQPGRQQQSAQEMAAIDITGNWVALVTEDWRFRMVVAAAGDYEGIGLTPRGGKLPMPGILMLIWPQATPARPMVLVV